MRYWFHFLSLQSKLRITFCWLLSKVPGSSIGMGSLVGCKPLAGAMALGIEIYWEQKSFFYHWQYHTKPIQPRIEHKTVLNRIVVKLYGDRKSSKYSKDVK